MTSSWWSCDIFLPTSSESAIFQERVLKTHSFNIRIYIRIFEYNSKFKYKHSNLRLKHYLHYKVSWKGTNKSYKTCYFGLHIPRMQSFLKLYKSNSLNVFYHDVTDFNQVPPTLLIYHHGESRKMCRLITPRAWRNYWITPI